MIRPSAVVRQESLTTIQIARLRINRERKLANPSPAVPRARRALLCFNAQLAALRSVGRGGIVHRAARRRRIRVHEPVRALVLAAGGRDEGRGRAARVQRCAGEAGGCWACGCDGVGGAAVGGAGHGCLGECGVVGECGGAGGLEEGVGLAVGGGGLLGDGAGAGVEAEGALVGCWSGCGGVGGWGGITCAV